MSVFCLISKGELRTAPGVSLCVMLYRSVFVRVSPFEIVYFRRWNRLDFILIPFHSPRLILGECIFLTFRLHGEVFCSFLKRNLLWLECAP